MCIKHCMLCRLLMPANKVWHINLTVILTSRPPSLPNDDWLANNANNNANNNNNNNNNKDL